jgi:hypothetical protein
MASSTATTTASTTKQKYDRIKLKNQHAHQQQNYQHFSNFQENFNSSQNRIQRINCSTSQICKRSNGDLEIQQFEYYDFGNEYDNLNTDHGYYYYSYNNNYCEYDNIENLTNDQSEASTNNNNNNMKNSKSLILLSQYRNQNNLNNNSNLMSQTKANKYANRYSANSEMKRSSSSYNYYRTSSSHSLKPLSISNNSLNKSVNTWYKPKNLELPSSKSQININSQNNDNKNIASICSSVASALINGKRIFWFMCLNLNNTVSYFYLKLIFSLKNFHFQMLLYDFALNVNIFS